MTPLVENARTVAAVGRAAAVGRRRPTTGAAQEKRQAWGREHGAFYAELKRKRQESER